MVFKLFPNGLPSDSLRDDLNLLLNASAADHQIVERWFKDEGTAPDFDWDRFRASASATSLLPEQFDRIGGSLRSLLESWHRSGASFDDVLADLVLLGFSDDQSQMIGTVLRSLQPYRDRVFQRGMLQFTRSVGLPSLEDFNLVCELRPVFEDFAYLPSRKLDVVDYSRLLELLPIIVMEISTSDGKKFAVQLTEQEFSDLHEAMNRASTQMTVLKQRVYVRPMIEEGNPGK